MTPTARRLTLAAIALSLAACGGSEPAPTAQQAPQQDPAATPIQEQQAAAAAPETPAKLLERANAALSDDRLFEPAGDNALELYLAAIERAESEATEGEDEAKRARRLSDAMGQADLVTQTRMAISDILPYGLVWVERSIRAGEFSEASRVLGLLERAQPGANSLQRLRDQLAQAEADAERAALAAERAAAQAAAQAAAAAAQPAAPAPAQEQPVAPAPAPVTTPAAPAQQPAAATPTAPAQVQPAAPQPAAPAPAPAPATPATLPAGAMPRLVSQPSLRYPVQALRRGTEGYVQVAFVIQPDGSTADVRIIRADPRGVFEREATRVVEGLKFAPPGRAIPTERQIDFKLDR